MSCPQCGAHATADSAFCRACGAALRAAPPSTGDSYAWIAGPGIERPGVVTTIAVLDFLAGFIGLVVASLLAWAAHANADARVWLTAAAAVAGLGALAHIACGVGLLALQAWARVLQIALAIFSICSPISILVLVYLLRPGVRLSFSGRRLQDMSPPELQSLERDARIGGATVGVLAGVLAVLLVGAVPMTGIIAAIAIPALLRARVSANEASAQTDARLLVAAQASYATHNGGFYEGRLECLSAPSGCLPAGAPGTTFLSSPMSAQAVKAGYERRFVAGPVSDPNSLDARRHSSTSVVSFVYVAVPLHVNQTGIRGFCGDHTGRVCATSSPEALRDLDGSACPAQPLCESSSD